VTRVTAAPVVGVVEKRGRFLTATPFFERGRRINLDRDKTARLGDLVLVAPSGPRAGHGRIARRIGRPDVARDVLEALMLDRGLRRRFDPAVDRQAREAAQSPPADTGPRRDLTTLPTFTIDPPTARDFDDAVSAERLDDDAIRIWVHIADVAAHVPPGSAVDREAFRRATSVYVPSLVEPMLPEALSNDACSLRPGVERLAVTVEMDLEGARTRRTAFYRSRIRSDMRLDYPQVDRIFAGTERAEGVWAQPLEAARAAAAALEAARAAKGALAVDTAEPQFAFNRDGHVTELVPEEQTESHRVIEHLMIAANEAVATLLDERGLPALYRVHEQPDPPRIEHLVDQLISLDVPTYVKGRGGVGGIGFTSVVLRSLKQAYYSPKNLGHAGLRSARYCHFTSPIRRYPDLICHRALLSAVGAGEAPPERASLEDAGSWCSARERDAMAIERRADAVARCFLLEQELFQAGWETEFEGEITGVIGAGAFIAFGDGHEGMLPVRLMRGDWWELNELETMLVGSDSARALRIGDPVTVQVRTVDAPRGRVDLSPVQL
jgi:ribonuclease R